MKAAVVAKLQAGRPVRLDAEESAFVVETLRAAVATTLEMPPQEVTDGARIFDDLGMDSIDVFDVLDQLSQQLEIPVALDQLPEAFLRGDPGTTFRAFADGLLRFFREPPPPPPGSSSARAG